MASTRERIVEIWRANERERMRARLRAEIVPGLEELVDPAADPADLIALADRQSRRLRAELESLSDTDDVISLDPVVERAREEEREWLRGHLHDTALQILEFIAGDGFGTGLSASQISTLAGGAAHDLHRWIDGGDEQAAAELLPELEQVTAEARLLDPRVELVVGHIGTPPTSEQVAALAGAVREAVTNARKHSQATHVIVRVETGSDGRTAVTVTDDGVGIDPELVANATGLGVKGSIVGRMKRVGGHASLEDAPGGGTLVTLITSRQGA
ncbi:MAG TPA: ATP-binding protein [Solirubrobacteraceae bacterium]|nr:ATP-binding protein [Solirubrobacteraceae bacterium]HEV7882888.1 ATP-binding protein [Solirubrobacteraceae bacterium]